MQIFLILAFSIAVLFSDDKLLFKGLVDNNYTLIKENLNKENINKDFSKAEFLKEIEFGELGKTRKIRNYIHAMQKISIGIEKSLVLLAYSGASRPLDFYIFINEFKDRPFDEKILDLFFEFKPDLNYRTEGYTTPMQLVITSESISDNDTKKIIERMLKSGIDVNYDLSFNHELARVSYTMLDMAYANIKKETAKFLKANGGEIKEQSYSMISVSKAWSELKNDEFFLDEFIYWGKKGKIPNKDYDKMIKFCQREKYQSCIDKINQIKIATLPLKEFESLYLSNVKKMGIIGIELIAEKEYKEYKEYKRGLESELETFKNMRRLDDEDITIFERMLKNETEHPEKFNIMEEIDKELKSSLNPKLEIAILSDTTGSMSGAINSVKAQAKNIVETAFSKDENARIAVFGYNDPNVQTFANLTNNKSAIISAINALYARDGGDTPEMTYKGLINAASSSWSPNADKKIIIFGDAPAKDTYNKAEAYALLSGGGSNEPMAKLALLA
ncbi:MAG: VWA domain-containing protein [Campylobacter sp.]|uniref:vWA domain-containing protein n=1 Tax=Campylobacter sp. TaxID=205 RepID=UPI002AA662E3|nr:vWA domain-containing protein [Campylobacter sp.]MCI6343297.1 VWA domain-containing protein [Campylobacter sp.]MCI7362288.1 VWA domain-containing protein [Campylobacter sp.]